jgi:hypothetical protein
MLLSLLYAAILMMATTVIHAFGMLLSVRLLKSHLGGKFNSDWRIRGHFRYLKQERFNGPLMKKF